MSYNCSVCGNETLIKVAEDENRRSFYSCYTENCEQHAKLQVQIDVGVFVPQQLLLDKLVETVEEYNNEQNNIQESED
jgi:hypothetical protein